MGICISFKVALPLGPNVPPDALCSKAPYAAFGSAKEIIRAVKQHSGFTKRSQPPAVGDIAGEHGPTWRLLGISLERLKLEAEE